MNTPEQPATEANNQPAPTGVVSGALLGVVKLTKPQRELYDAMLGGMICHYMPYRGWVNPNAYYYRDDNCKKCTKAAQSLEKRGLVERFDEDWRGHKIRVKTPNTRI